MMRAILVALAMAASQPAFAQPDTQALQSSADNAELAQMFADDQQQRSGDVDWEQVNREDAARRARARQMIDAGEVRTGADFFAASIIFQHGDKPEDYLLAHVLAVRALALGAEDAEWLVAATLDRYLQSIGQPQVYGTQYGYREETGATMQPYNPALLTDAIRISAGVSSLSDQEKRLQEFADSIAASIAQ